LAGKPNSHERTDETEEQRRKPKGGFTIAQVPVTAPDTLAEGEFNRFYIRGLCLRAIQDGVAELIVYRAKEVSSPRRESEAMIGARLPPERLLQDIRTHPGVDTAFGLPPGPNSGLSVHLLKVNASASLNKSANPTPRQHYFHHCIYM
jgi:hypothetical protein